MEAFFRGSHTTNFVTWGFSRSYNQAAEVPSSKVTCKSPRSPAIKSRTMLAFVSMTHSITIFPAPFLTAIKCFPGAHPCRYTFGYPLRALLSVVGSSQTLKTLLQKGRPFILRRIIGQVRSGTRHVQANPALMRH